jgi:hypothetical protein
MAEGRCAIYKDRPENPCKSFNCEWLLNPNIPEWMKPNVCNAILREVVIGDVKYWHLIEAGQRLDARVLAWIVTYCLQSQINLMFEVDGGSYKIGASDFIDAIDGKQHGANT